MGREVSVDSLLWLAAERSRSQISCVWDPFDGCVSVWVMGLPVRSNLPRRPTANSMDYEMKSTRIASKWSPPVNSTAAGRFVDDNKFLKTAFTSKSRKFVRVSLAQPLKNQSLAGYKSLFAQISKSFSKTWIDDYVQPNALIMKSMMCKFVWLPNYLYEKPFLPVRSFAQIIKSININLNSRWTFDRKAEHLTWSELGVESDFNGGWWLVESSCDCEWSSIKHCLIANKELLIELERLHEHQHQIFSQIP